MIIEIAIAAAVIIAVLIIVIAARPSNFRVTRSAAIAASPPVVFENVNDLRLWEAWSPWERMDPTSRKTFDGPPAGPGASYAWAGKKTGEGKMAITESHPNDLIRMNLDFLKPFKASNTVEFTFRPEGNQTVVTWSMSGKNNFLAKAFGLVVNCDKMCGNQFEDGLANLKSVAEAGTPISRI